MIKGKGTKGLDEFWGAHVKNCRNSSGTMAAYCRDHNLQYDRFWWWQKRIKNRAKADFIPIRISSQMIQTTHFVKQAVDKPYCTIEYAQGKRLLIQSKAVLSMIPELLAINPQ